MSEFEDPVSTVVRLLQRNVQVVKDDGSIANIDVSREWCDRELLKNCDGQVTVGLAESRDMKVEMSGRIRRRVGALRVNVWTTDKPTTSDMGKTMRNKMVEEVNRAVRQNRSKPNETAYDFAGVGTGSTTHRAYQMESAGEPSPQDANWTELTSTDLEKIWYSDDTRYSKSHSVNGEYALMLFRFKIDSREKTVKQLSLTFEGYGTAPAGNGVTVKVWNHAAQAWQNAQTGTGGADETISITLSSNLADYVDDQQCVCLLARTTNPSDGATPAIINCDYTSCTVTVNGITYLDIVSFRDADRVDVKPFIYRTECTLTSSFFEDVGEVL